MKMNKMSKVFTYLIFINLVFSQYIFADARVKPQNNPAWKELHQALLEDDKSAVEALIAKKVDPDQKNGYNETLAMWCVQEDRLEGLRILSQVKADLEHRTNRVISDLPRVAARYDSKKCLALLIEMKIDLNPKYEMGLSVLACAVMGGHTDCVRLLLRASGNPNERYNTYCGKMSLVSFAVYIDCVPVLKLLLDSKAQVKAVDLHQAITKEKNPACALALIKAKADPEKINEKKFTALMSAIMYSNQALVCSLLQLKVNVNAKTSSGLTSLHYALRRAETSESLDLLLKAKAEPNTPFPSGKTPCQVAEERGFLDALQLLISFKASP